MPLYPGIPHQPYSFLIKKLNGLIVAQDDKGRIRFSGADATTVIQSAIDALPSGGRIFFKDPVNYEVSSTLTGKSHLQLEGEVFAREDGQGTRITWVGADGGGPILNFEGKESWEIRNLQINGDDKATVGIKGLGLATRHARNVMLTNVYVHHCKQIGIDFGGAETYRVVDSVLNNIWIGNCPIGFTGYMQGIVYNGGGIFRCTTAGVQARDYSGGISFRRVVFSQNAVDIQFKYTSPLLAHSFYNCWFELSTITILNRADIPLTPQRVDNILFSSCQLHTSGAKLFDLTDIYTTLIIEGGAYDTASNSSLIDNPEIHCFVHVLGVEASDGLTFTRTGQYIKRYSFRSVRWQNSGTATISASTSVTFDHGLVGTPRHVECGFKTPGYGSWSWSATSTQITITVEVSGTYDFSWSAEV